MGRRSAYTVPIHDGREIGYGLVQRDGVVYSVQFRDADSGKFIFRSTGEKARPRALKKAEQIVKDHYAPPDTIRRQAGWDEVAAELRQQLEADAARPATVKDYLDTLQQVRDAAACPAALSPGLAQLWCNEYLAGTFKRGKGVGAKEYSRSPVTLHSRVRKLSAIWSKYLVRRLRVAAVNPWEGVDLPKLNDSPVRTLSQAQVDTFFEWLAVRWKGWELPSLFFEVKAVTGCRLADLAAARSSGLVVARDGEEDLHVITFDAVARKERKARVGVLAPDLFQKVKSVAGPTFVWESYATEIAKFLTLRGVPTHRVNPTFDPARLTWWAKDEVDDFNKARPGQPKIQSHDFRKRYVTLSRDAGVDVDDAAAGAGMSPATARAHYLALDQAKAAATVAAKIGAKLRPRRPETKTGE